MNATVRDINVTFRIVGVTCGSCGVPFGLENAYLARLKEDGRTFYCPNGHPIWYGENENKRLKREVAEKERLLEVEKGQAKWYRDRLDVEQSTHRHTERKLRGTKGALTRVKRRVGAGRCPCCSHTFKDLGRHMKGQHPDWDPDKHAESLAAKES